MRYMLKREAMCWLYACQIPPLVLSLHSGHWFPIEASRELFQGWTETRVAEEVEVYVVLEKVGVM